MRSERKPGSALVTWGRGVSWGECMELCGPGRGAAGVSTVCEEQKLVHRVPAQKLGQCTRLP